MRRSIVFVVLMMTLISSAQDWVPESGEYNCNVILSMLTNMVKNR